MVASDAGLCPRPAYEVCSSYRPYHLEDMRYFVCENKSIFWRRIQINLNRERERERERELSL